jgi:hydrogenase maturation protease
MMRRVKSAVVLACGNTLRGDDGVAWTIGSELERSILDGSLPCADVEVIFTQQLLPEHAERISRTDVAIMIDCSAVAVPGAVSTIQLHAADCLPGMFTHHLDPASLLTLTQNLYGCIPSQAVAITVGGQSFDLTEQLTKPVADAVPIAKAAVCAVLCAR